VLFSACAELQIPAQNCIRDIFYAQLSSDDAVQGT
jgi:hypothetical protein